MSILQKRNNGTRRVYHPPHRIAQTVASCNNSDMSANPKRKGPPRAGAAAVDYVLILAVVLPMVVFLMWVGPRMIRLAYDLTCLVISWPFM